jgi:hypothetical protein
MYTTLISTPFTFIVSSYCEDLLCYEDHSILAIQETWPSPFTYTYLSSNIWLSASYWEQEQLSMGTSVSLENVKTLFLSMSPTNKQIVT